MASALLGLTYLAEGSAGNIPLVNTAVEAFDAISRAGIKDRDLAAPPGSPADGDAYIIGTSPTGLWAGQAAKFTHWSSSSAAWRFYTPKEGWKLYVDDEDLTITYDGTNWLVIEPHKSVVLTDAATIAVDVSKGRIRHVTLGGNRTLGAPTGNPYDGEELVVRVRQDATGTRTLSYNAIYRFSTTRPSPTLSTTAAKEDYLIFRYSVTDTKWDIIEIDLGH